MKHYVVTKFSLIIDGWRKTFDNREDWFIFRTKLFFKSNYQSIIQNKTLPRKILVLFDTNDKNLFEKYFVKNDPNSLIHPIFTNSDKVKELVEKYVFDDIKVNESYVLTRIDSDDIVCSNFFDVINNHISQTQKNFYVVIKGYRTDLKNIVKMSFKNSPFISIYYNRELLPFIFDFNHTSVNKYNPYLIEKTCFMQIIHGTNVSNHLPDTNPIITRFRYFLKKILKPRDYKYFVESKKFHKNKYLEMFQKIEFAEIKKIIQSYKAK